MEQNNNNDNKAMEAIKNTAKNVAKKETNKVLGKILIKILPAIGIFFLCLLAVGLVMAVFVTIINFFKGLFGLNNQSAMSIASQVNQKVSITSNGYELKKEYSKNIIEELQSFKVDTDAMGLTSDDTENEQTENIDTLDDMIDKYIKAEIKTMYPSIGGSGSLDGLVKIYRMSAETGKSKQMFYKEYNQFMKEVDNGDTRVLNYFTLNPDNFQMYIAVSTTTIYYDYNEEKSGNKVESNRTTVIEAKQVDYQTYLQSYGTPLNFFIAMHLVTGDKAFMNKLVDMVNDKNQIELTFVESTEKEFVQVDYEGEITTTTWVTKSVSIQPTNGDDENNGSTSILDELDKEVTIDTPKIDEFLEENDVAPKYETISSSNTYKINTGNISEFNEYIEPKQYLIEKITGQGYLKVTTANTWRLKSNLSIQVNDAIKSYIQENEITLPNPEKKHTVDIKEDNNIDESSVGMGAFSVGYIDEITNEWLENYSISVTENEKGYEITDFMQLIENYPKVKNNLETSPSLLFYLLEENESTQELAGLMKYIIYEYTGIDYGITDLDDLFQLQNFNTVGGLYGSSVEEKLWWALIDAGYPPIAAAGVMGNIQAESGFNPMSVQKDYKKDNPEQYRLDYTNKVDNGAISEDEFVNHGPDGGGYGLAQWTYYSRKQGLYDYAKDVRKCSIGDANMQIEYLLAEMSLTGGAEGKTTCQFLNVEAEGKIWTRDTWLNASSAGEAAKAYSYSFEGPAVYNSERAAYAEALYKKYKDAERPSTAIAIIQAADYIHQYMEENQYTYCVYDCNEYEECDDWGKEHGLNSTFEASLTGHHNSCCATFVSWALQEAGCITNNLHSNSANELADNLENSGWIRVSISDAQPGDVLCKDHHIEIYAGDGTTFNAGSGKAIRGASPASRDINIFAYALRAPN